MKIKYTIGDDYSWEKVEVLDDNGDEITSLCMSSESPEDNTVGRLGLLSFITKIVVATGGVEPEIEKVQE